MVSQVNLKCDFGKGVSEDIYTRYGESGRVVSFDFVNSNIEGGVVEVSNARFCMVKSDGNFVIQDFDNSVGLDLTSNMCASSGVGSYEVQVSVDGVVVSGRGSFIVSDRVWNDEVVESVSEGNGLVFPDDFQEKLVAGDGIKIEGNVISWDGTVDWTRWYREMKEWRESSLIFGEAKFETVEEGLLKELVVGVESVQDLHGYDYPWIGGTGKNLIQMTLDNIKQSNVGGTWVDNIFTSNAGITYIINTDNDNNITSIEVNGTTSSTASNFYLSQYDSQVNNHATFDINKNYIISGGNNNIRVGIWIYDENQNFTKIVYSSGDNVNIDMSNAYYYTPLIQIPANTTVDGTVYPMLRYSTETDATFEPYTNICPISGWSSVEVSLKDVDGVSQREYSIALGQTVYGGVLDVVKGELRVDKVSVDLGSLDWSYSPNNHQFYSNDITNTSNEWDYNVLCECYQQDSKSYSNMPSAHIRGIHDYSIYIIDEQFSNEVTSFKNAINGMLCIYPLATPITIQLTPQEILALDGVNNISTDSGGVVSCVYSKIANYISARNVLMDNGETVQKAVSDLQ